MNTHGESKPSRLQPEFKFPHPVQEALRLSPDALVISTRGSWRYYYLRRYGLVLRTHGDHLQDFDRIIEALTKIARNQKHPSPLRWAFLTYMAQVRIQDQDQNKETPNA